MISFINGGRQPEDFEAKDGHHLKGGAHLKRQKTDDLSKVASICRIYV
jgi:hypothetical protein